MRRKAIAPGSLLGGVLWTFHALFADASRDLPAGEFLLTNKIVLQ